MTVMPKGFRFAAIEANLKYSGRKDLSLLVSDTPASAAGVFTTNKFQASPVLQCKAMLERSRTHSAFLVNAGSANACTGEEGARNCRETLNLVAEATGVPADEILPASTGVIGLQFDMDKWRAAMPALAESLGNATPEDMSEAIMTTDTRPKLVSTSVELSGGEVRLLGMCKGAGMISPNMATLLAFVCCDADVAPQRWQEILEYCADNSFNRITIDGDTSTNDSFMGLANGASGVKAETEEDLRTLCDVLLRISQELAYMIVEDAEGGTKVARIEVKGARDEIDAELVARAIGFSPLVKTALFGCDANWGRIMCAAGYSGAEFDAEAVTLDIGGIRIFEKGMPVPGDMDILLEPVMNETDIPITVTLGSGPGTASLLASDLTKEYVEINADYRS